MKYLFLILLVTIIVYVSYQSTDTVTRKKAMKKITYHGFRIGAIFVVIAAIAAAAYYLPVSTLTI